MPRVLIADKLEAPGIELLKAAGLEVDNRPGLKADELKAAIRGADAVICRSQPKLSAEYFEDTGSLRAIARAGVGVDNIDVAAATRKGVVVMNTPGGNTVSAAEHTIALLLALARRVPVADATMKAGGWDRNKFVGTEVAGKTLGVVGLGRIGREVARRAKGMDMKVIALDPFVTAAKAAELGYETAANLDELLPKVDFLTLHVPLGNDTKSLIGARELGLMKKSARVLNVARGGIVDEKALADALAAGTIAGAGIDVFTVEPIVADNPLLKAPNIVLTPHLGASTLEAQENVAIEAAQLIADFLLKGQVANAVNMAAVNPAELAEVRPFVDLARRLGLLQAQIAQGTIRRASLTYRGELAGQKTRLLTAAFTAGMLEYRLSEGVNLVNAEVLARERGIEIAESSNPKKGDFAALLHTEVETEKGTTVAAGTLFGDQYLRLVQLGPYRMEGYLDGVLLVFTHHDVPGLIGFVGTIFGTHAVNIAQMTVGRQAPGGEAIGILNLDNLPPEAALAAVKNHAHISSVTVVKLPAAGELPAWLG
ncbi:d-3-phosphoglycerate dehydrogenase : D-3-phosphoglycerate dehydrogenase OS=Singulisphaera acidiphila (strain ATCC BAA-1392 / DSM 18658 / VKM B-2454 / MOB10) GN=Sinac_6245 PE=3 SV=1: 2-Hacid_dh: 2-Hacid_dh_C [Gemmata massiliana]|uniref:D-3-phosphoglycerate dehydrogenase n=1 Tax=Gemmata massiliana TaxID=1210884 RepID=A0A6P2DB96_9BACT|nr:phosphoglycerate dehydrogenase [Gemmata massiliana]VTR98274.1 d-3-phosphoglycerate dehydrogenase : D-3-phosphoglycerate dehydrogenase OS=Singulisphaera acidiphila (strain ATCC BAA-1392 / DSM 18658 / VKM B-2454 / MOB10) GN=Sinac_6245 PE=3 SV=1: 2-Hacid_dh: 2-Hacid_dh_C [Gemmata massiliana]